MRVLLSAVIVVTLGFVSSVSFVRAQAPGVEALARGQASYEAGAFDDARVAFEAAVAADPRVSEYYHWLGKACGRIAETSGPITAFRYARRTRDAFETAVRLDGTNRGALESLLLYYEEAPRFLGGGEDKAASIRERLQALGDGT